MGYFDWNNNGRLDSIDTAMELMMLDEIEKQKGIGKRSSTGGNFLASAVVVGLFIWIISFI